MKSHTFRQSWLSNISSQNNKSLSTRSNNSSNPNVSTQIQDLQTQKGRFQTTFHQSMLLVLIRIVWLQTLAAVIEKTILLSWYRINYRREERVRLQTAADTSKKSND